MQTTESHTHTPEVENTAPTGPVSIIVPTAADSQSQTKDDAETQSQQSPSLSADDYAKQAYECFIKNADPDTSDANPVAAIQRIFNQRASDELKAQCAAECKTAEGAYQFLWAVARLCKQTDGGCHISPETGYAIAMHYFQDVPASVLDEFEPALKKQKEEREAAEAKERAAKLTAEAKEKAKAKKARAAKKASKTPQDAPATGKKPSKPTPPSSAQTTLFDELFA